MNRSVFEERLGEIGRRAVMFARELVLQRLPDEVAFRVYPNQSFDDNSRVQDDAVFPNESLPEGQFLGPWSAHEVVEYLWRNEKVPEWIDAAIEAEDGRRSLIGLRCCGRFTASEELLYHRPGGLAPFSIKSPALPPGWQSVEASGRFDLNWRIAYLCRGVGGVVMRLLQRATIAGVAFGLPMGTFFAVQFGATFGIATGLLAGLFFGVLLAAFAAWKQAGFTRRNPCMDGERLLKHGPANHFRGLEGVGGWLYLTDQRLLFRAHRVNLQSHELSVRMQDIGSPAVHDGLDPPERHTCGNGQWGRAFRRRRATNLGRGNQPSSCPKTFLQHL